MNKKFIIVVIFMLFAPTSVFADNYIQRIDVQSYIKYLVAEHSFSNSNLEKIFTHAKQNETVLKLIKKPYEAKPWYLYRQLFLTDKHINNGLAMWRKNQVLLEKISQHYQVPVEIILAVIGVETFYGDITGDFPVLYTLITLGFDYPPRAKFFRDELTHLLLLAREEGVSLDSLFGSYAGAMGIGQFIPSSYRTYAVDFDKDGVRDLWGSLPDALASVANYFAEHGWEWNQATAHSIQLQGDLEQIQANQTFKPLLTADSLSRKKIRNSTPMQSSPFALFSYTMDKKGNLEYWAGYNNFYVITRYNRSHRYALAIYLLSKELKRKYKKH